MSGGRRRGVMRSALGTGAGTAVGMTVSLTLTPLLVGGLGPEAYGTWVAIVTLGALISLADLGVRTEIIRRASTARVEGGRGVAEVVNEGVGLLLLGAAGPVALVLLTAPVWIHWIIGSTAEPVAWLVVAVLVLALVEMTASAHHSALLALQLADLEQLGRILGTIATAVVAAGAVAAGGRLSALVIARAAGVVLTVAVHHQLARRHLPQLRFRPKLPRRGAGWLQLPLLALLSQIADVVDSQTDKLVISAVSGAAGVSAYHIGTTLVLQLRTLILVALSPLLPALSAITGDDARRVTLFRKASTATYVFGIPVLGAVTVFGGPFISLWIAADVEPAGMICTVFGIAMLVNLFSAPLTLRALAEARHGIVAVSAACNVATNAAASIVLTVAVGPVGAAAGSLVGTVVGVAYIVVAYGRATGTWPLARSSGFWLLAAGFVVAAVVGVPRWEPSWSSLVLVALPVTASAFLLAVLLGRRDLPPLGDVLDAVRGWGSRVV